MRGAYATALARATDPGVRRGGRLGTRALAFARGWPPATAGAIAPGGMGARSDQVTLNLAFIPAAACGSHW